MQRAISNYDSTERHGWDQTRTSRHVFSFSPGLLCVENFIFQLRRQQLFKSPSAGWKQVIMLFNVRLPGTQGGSTRDQSSLQKVFLNQQ